MASNWKKDAKVINWVNGLGSSVASGAVVVLGAIIGIAQTLIENTKTGAVGIDGEYELAAINTAAFVIGDRLYWDATAGKLTNVPTAVFAGLCTKAKLEAGTTARVKLAGAMPGAGLIVAAGIFDTLGGDATESITLAGVVATDVAVVTLHTAGTTPRTVSSCAAGAGKVDVVMSGDPSTDHKLNYVVVRPFA